MKRIFTGYSRLLACRASFAIFVLLCTCGPALAQNIYNGSDLVFDTQAGLDAFQNGSKYTEANASIKLDGKNTTDPITDLGNLSALTDIGGKLTIVGWGTDEQSRLTGDPLSAFQRLTSLTNLEIGDFNVNNMGITSATAPLLTEIGAGLQIRNCSNLDNIVMPELLSVTNSFNLDDLESLTELDDFLTITGNDNLGNCCALPCKTTVNGKDFDGTNDAVTVRNNTGDCADKQAVTNSCGGACIATPVELARFRASRQADGSVLLDWETLSETDNDRFEIERAVGEWEDLFVTIHTEPSKGNGTGGHTYAARDDEALAGNRYYRLRQVDHDGTYSYGPVSFVSTREDAVAGIRCYPNPVTGATTQLELSSDDWGSNEVVVTVFDANGRSHPRAGER